MTDVEYLGPASFSLTLVPARAAYLIAPGSETGFRSAIQEACTRWGGVTEPILEVTTEGLNDWSEQLLELANVDGLVNVDADKGSAQALVTALGMQLTDLKYIDRSGITQFSTNPACVSDWADDPNPPVIASAASALWEAVAAGDLNDVYLKQYEDQGQFVRRPPSDDGVGRAQMSRATLLERTLASFDVLSASGFVYSSPAVLWLTRPNSFDDCLAFWNMRAISDVGASRAPIILLPDNAADDWLNLRQQLHGLLRRPNEFSPDVVLATFGLDEDRLKQIAAALELVESAEEPRYGIARHAEVRTAPFTFRADMDPRTPLIFQRTYGARAQVDSALTRPKTSIRAGSPVSFTGAGLTMLHISTPAFAALPKRETIAELLVTNGGWKDGGLRILTNAMTSYALELNMPTNEEVVSRLLADATSSHRLSDKGKLGRPLQSAEALPVLLQPRFIETCQALTTPRSRELLRELRAVRKAGGIDRDLVELALGWGGRAERKYRAAAQLADAGGSLDAAELLVALGWGQRGLEVRCDHCGISSFVSLPQTLDRAVCPGCGDLQDYTRRPDAAGVETFYRLTTFVDRASDQGLLPPLAAVAELTRRQPDSYLLPGVDVTFHDGEVGEVDVFGIHGGNVIAGEVKTSGGDFTEVQVLKDVGLSARLKADIHLMACLHPIPDIVIDFAAELCEETGLELLALHGPAFRPAT